MLQSNDCCPRPLNLDVSCPFNADRPNDDPSLLIVCRLIVLTLATLRAMNLPERFGQKVRERRQAIGLSQDAFAEKCGLHRTYVGAVERGERNITLINAERIANALEVQLATLLSDV